METNSKAVSVRENKFVKALRVAAELNVAQWLSALGTLTVAFITVYALFFSETSSALIKYLHSELSVRNLKISELETKEQNLQVAVQRKESELSALIEQTEKIRTTLSTTEFSLVKEKISGKLSSTIVVTWPSDVGSEFHTAQGVRPRTVSFWTDYLKYIRDVADTLAPNEKIMGQLVVQRFTEQCAHLSKVTIRLPAIRSALMDYKHLFSLNAEEKKKYEDEWKKLDKEASQKLSNLNDLLFKTEDQIRKCFAGLKQQ